jgi:hypothetical protein
MPAWWSWPARNRRPAGRARTGGATSCRSRRAATCSSSPTRTPSSSSRTPWTRSSARCRGRADLVSGLPKQLLGTLGETVFVPLFYWAFFCFTPLAAGLVWRRAAFTRAVGQLMAFRREAYDAVGGHAAIRASVVDDLDLARRIASAGLACRIVDATGIVSCRMYRSGREAVAGFGRNLFAAFGYAILPYAFVWGWLAFVHLAPIALLALHVACRSACRPTPRCWPRASRSPSPRGRDHLRPPAAADLAGAPLPADVRGVPGRGGAVVRRRRPAAGRRGRDAPSSRPPTRWV